MPGVVRLLLPDTKVEGEEEREALRDAVLANTAELLDQMPRDVEFTYNNKMDKLKPLLSSPMVPYTTLLENLHLPKAHYEEATCPMVCGQKQNCHRIRETMSLVDLIVAELGKRFKVFEGMDIAMIGSTREGSRAFFYDEVDVHLSLNKDFKKFSYFDAKQMVLKRDPSRAENPEDCDKYFDENNFLKPDLYFHDFVASVHSIISTLELPEDFTMLPLTTSFTPCTRCMTTKHKGLQVMRCRHKADCEQHKRCRCEEPSKCKCLEECGCREYASPSLNWSKVGVVLHLQWREEDGTLSTIDVDLNCPTWPTNTRFDGSIQNASNNLELNKPVGWLEELHKLDNMFEASGSPHLLESKNWPVKFRLINRETVLPSQTLLFMRDETLAGVKLEAYVLIKILKYLTGSSARSFQCKFATNFAFGGNKIIKNVEIGSAVQEIINHQSIRGKFSSVHPDLAVEGITMVEVKDEGFLLTSNKTAGSLHLNIFFFKLRPFSH